MINLFRCDAGGEQGIALKIQNLTAISLRDSGISDQYGCFINVRLSDGGIAHRRMLEKRCLSRLKFFAYYRLLRTEYVTVHCMPRRTILSAAQ